MDREKEEEGNKRKGLYYNRIKVIAQLSYSIM